MVWSQLHCILGASFTGLNLTVRMRIWSQTFLALNGFQSITQTEISLSFSIHGVNSSTIYLDHKKPYEIWVNNLDLRSCAKDFVFFFTEILFLDTFFFLGKDHTYNQKLQPLCSFGIKVYYDFFNGLMKQGKKQIWE